MFDDNGNDVLSTLFLSDVAGQATETSAPDSAAAAWPYHPEIGSLVGQATTVIEVAGATALVQIGNHYFLTANDGSSPEVQIGVFGAPLTVGQFQGWTPIAAEQSPGGYTIALKADGGDQYLLWAADSTGHHLSNGGVLRGSSYALQSQETGFHQDLNADGGIGPQVTKIESSGSTTLSKVADSFFMAADGSSGPQLSLAGAPVTLDQFPGWTFLGAEQTPDGYELVLKVVDAELYIVWKTDSAGHYLANSGIVSATSWILQSHEAGFAQDLNHDGVIGPTTTTIEAFGTTTLAQVADAFFLYPAGSTSGPQVSLFGAPATLGQIPGWSLIGAERMSDGYEVVLKVVGAPLYIVWQTDTDGNYLSNSGVLSAGSWSLQSLEASFAQDINDDRLTGPSTTVVEAAGSTSLVRLADTFFLYESGTSSGPQLSLFGAPVTTTQFAGWTFLAVEDIGGTYEIVLKVDGTPLYIVWTADSSGAYMFNSEILSPGRYALQSLELGFGQDLNGDARIGPTVTVVESFGLTRLNQVADTYFLHSFDSASGPQLTFAGVPVTAEQFAGWSFIAAERNSSGYQVVLKVTGAEYYIAWNVDLNGNYLSNTAILSATSWSLQDLELGFQQDLNRDTVTGLRTTIIEASGSTILAQVADRYFFYPISTMSGPQLSFAAAPVTVGQFAGWTLIAVEQSGSGYQVALKVIGAGQYIMWSTDGSGRYLANSAIMAGSSSALQSLEPSFQQDLNGDGWIGVPVGFDIDFAFSGDSSYRSYFEAAARRWEEVIVADLPDTINPVYGFIDDMLISVTIEAIDGVGRILGQAGPDWLRSSSRLPTHGKIVFDAADVAAMVRDNVFADVVLHEIGHVLGIGSLWADHGLSSGSQYFGGYGVATYRELSGNGAAGSVPLETTGGSGTAGVHWSEATFGNELMTGFISGNSNPLSRLTISSLRDLGYTVNYAAADFYALPGRLAESGEANSLVNGEQAVAVLGSIVSFDVPFIEGDDEAPA